RLERTLLPPFRTSYLVPRTSYLAPRTSYLVSRTSRSQVSSPESRVQILTPTSSPFHPEPRPVIITSGRRSPLRLGAHARKGHLPRTPWRLPRPHHPSHPPRHQRDQGPHPRHRPRLRRRGRDHRGRRHGRRHRGPALPRGDPPDAQRRGPPRHRRHSRHPPPL